MKILNFLLLFVFFVLKANSQTLTHGEIRNFSDRIIKIVSLYDTIVAKENVHTEYIECFLKIDSIGRIVSMNLLADPKNVGQTYAILSRIPISIFDGWQVIKAKNRTILMPIIYETGHDMPDYVVDLKKSRGDNSIYFTIERETASMIILTPYYLWHYEPRYNEAVSSHPIK